MKITILQSTGISVIHEYLNFNRIPYESTDLWQQDLELFGRHIIGPELITDSNNLLILDYKIFHSMCQWSTSLEQIIKFCNNSNTIWVWADTDGLVSTINLSNHLISTINLSNQYLLSTINDKIPNGSIKLFLDGEWSDRLWLTKLSNIHHRVFPYTFFLSSLRLENADCNKVNCSRDFMLTMVKKFNRLHREILFNQINSIKGLPERGHINYSSPMGSRIGSQSHQPIAKHAGHPSMDLYQDAWLEIVPETLHRDGFMITEKTVKPIMTKTPFLIVSTCYYLEYLRQFGFKTFGNIIDERYDRQYRVEDRIQLMLAQLCDIVQNGSDAFYKECQPVLEHNQNRLFEISGRKQYAMDLFISTNLEEAGFC